METESNQGDGAGTSLSEMKTVDRSAVAESMARSNSVAGPRIVPAKVLPVPDLDSETAALIAAPYSEIWNLAPPDSAAWHSVLGKAADNTAPILAAARKALDVAIKPTTLGGVPAFVLAREASLHGDEHTTVLHLHGGGYVFGAGESGTGEAALVAAHTGRQVLSLDYRMPPDAPFPAALDDAVAVWRALSASTDPRRIAIEGTSAGGGLALALMLRCKDEGLPLPGALALGSPFADLTDVGDSLRTNEWVDNVIVTYDAYIAKAAKLYADGRDLREPYLSPVYGDLSGLPPTVLITGTRDLFLSTTVRVHRKLLQAGGEADLHVFEGMSHSQFLFGGVFGGEAPVTEEAFRQIASFLDRHLAK